MKIGEKILAKSKQMIAILLDNNLEVFNQAYLRAEGPLSISLGLKFSPDLKKQDFMNIEATINFVADRVKYSLEAQMSEAQEELFKEVKKLTPK